MIVRATADAEVRALIDALGDGTPARREAAIARLSILGSRAVARLVGAAESTADRARQLAILRVLQASADERALPVARRAVQAGGDLAVAAISLLTVLLERGRGETHARALDLLLAVSNDPRQERRVRAAAVDALTSASQDIRDAFGQQFAGIGSERDATWEEAIEARLPEDPAALADAVDSRAERAPLLEILRVIEAVRARESAEGPRQAEWQAVRGTLHQVAAARGSRVALYDLRETLEAARAPLPAAYLSAVRIIGDADCIEALAAAFRRATTAAWQHQLADTFHELAKRLKLTRRHAAMRRALAAAPDLDR
jgi:hypothetical protein